MTPWQFKRAREQRTRANIRMLIAAFALLLIAAMYHIAAAPLPSDLDQRATSAGMSKYLKEANK